MAILISFPFTIIIPQSFGIQTVEYSGSFQSLNSSIAKGNHTWWATFQKEDMQTVTMVILQNEEIADGQKPGWFPVEIPSNLLENQNSNKNETEAWYRKTILIPEEFDKHISIRLGMITDRDIIYFNGTVIGSTGEWDSPRVEPYDRIRIYEVPDYLVLNGKKNVILLHVKSLLAGELGIYKDHTEIGVSKQVWKKFLEEDYLQAAFLFSYLTVGFYFLFLYFRRKQNTENLAFGLFCTILVAYQFLRTQMKYELPVSFIQLKRTEYCLLFLIFPAAGWFVNSLLAIPQNKFSRFVHFIFRAVAVSTFLCIAVVLFTDSIGLWNQINEIFIQSITYPFYVIYILSVLIFHAFIKKNRDAVTVLLGAVAILVSATIDILSSRGILNIPSVTGYAFSLFVFTVAVVLANQLVRLQVESEAMNKNLQTLNTAFHRFVPTQFLEFLNKKSVVEIGLGDSALYDMSVLFSDIRSFTSMSEKMSPDDNFRFLNSYLKRMEPIVKKNQGFVDKYIGDAIMSLYPEKNTPGETSSDRAVRSGIEMQEEMKLYNIHRKSQGYNSIAIGTGIHTGKLMLGTVGSEDRIDTTVIGDTVNLASR
ncbi:MAG: adenylate/guanylate cyclase domain-containing protein, partial [Leptospira sp.]|nr:adenylate/guanylate cyclase domain-containing protein [Leptospira sp.]